MRGQPLVGVHMQPQFHGELDLSTDHGDDPPSAPTENVVGLPDRVGALEAFTEARKALGEGDVDRAVKLLNEARRRDPTDPLYPSYIEQVRERAEVLRKEHAEAAPTAPARAPTSSSTRKRLGLVGVVTLTALLTVWAVTRPSGSTSGPDVAQQYAQLAPFTRLSAAPGGGWIGAVDLPLAGKDEQQRHEWCRGILSALPRADQASLLLRSTDGQVVACSL